jgi:hypothetical protein
MRLDELELVYRKGGIMNKVTIGGIEGEVTAEVSLISRPMTPPSNGREVFAVEAINNRLGAVAETVKLSLEAQSVDELERRVRKEKPSE